MPSDNTEKNAKLLELMRKAVEHDKELREKYEMADKFRFIRDRLHALAAQIETGLTSLKKEVGQRTDQQAEDEVLVYVYLFNAQGITFPTWNKMLNPSVFYEYSVNRPIYLDKALIEAFIRSRSSKPQHAYLTVAIKKDAISKAPGTEALKDLIGGQLIKVKEGALHINRLMLFTHNDHEYVLDENGLLIKKNA